MKRLQKIITITLAALLMSLNVAVPVKAANAADWRAGNIIDDSVFNNKNAMDVTSIQAFLDAKVPTCDSNGTQPYAGTTRAAYSQSRGQTLPLICLKNYFENPTTKENNLQGRPIPNGALSAAQIISAAAQGYNINPQVLIVLLQKEQGLVTDDWPWEEQYRSATGYGCPDTAPCASQYYGFYNQVNNAAWQFRAYANNPNGFNHVAGTTNNIRLSPNAACGTMSVFIQNQATASLYNYTPYTPNQAALNNLYGTGDGCSAYGNRNFWRYFVDWFGASYANYSWSTVAQAAYNDPTKQSPVNLGQLSPGQRYYLTVTLRNNGNITWQRGGSNPVLLATEGPQDRRSPACDATWLNTSTCNRVALLHEDSVSPGQYGSFEFWITAPSTPGSYNEVFAPVMAGMSWMNANTISFPMYVMIPVYSGAVTGQNLYEDDSKRTPVDINHIVPGRKYYATVSIRNTGNVIWQREGPHPTNLITYAPRDGASPFCDSSTWERCSRPAKLRETGVAPGQTATFEFWISPPRPGVFTEVYTPILEGRAWVEDAAVTFRPRVEPYTWRVQEVRAFTDSSKSRSVHIGNLDPGQRYYLSVTLQNLGWAPWQRNSSTPFRLATAEPRDRASGICDATWLNCTRAATLSEPTVGSGQFGSLEFWMTAPSTPGNHAEKFMPVIDGPSPTWLGGNTFDLYMHVNNPRYSWDIIGQGLYTNSSKTTNADIHNLQKNQQYFMTMTVRNTSNVTWKNSGDTPMRLGTASPRNRTSPMCDASWIACSRPALLKETSVAPGQLGTFEFLVTTPNAAGTYNEIYAPLVDGVTWMDEHTALYPMTVK